MKPTKKLDEKVNSESVTVFGLPLRITPEIRDVTFRLSQTNPEKYAAIKKSIAAANGKLDEPIKVMKLGSETGDYYTIVDGHTRFEILMDLNILPADSNFVVLKDIMCVDDAKVLAYRLNGLRRQQNDFHQAVSTIRTFPTLSEREIEDTAGLTRSTIERVKYIIGSIESKNKTDIEMYQIQESWDNLAKNLKEIYTVYAQFKVAEDVSNAIAIIEEETFQKKMFAEFEATKYTDKSAMKKLQAKIDQHDAEAEGLDTTVDPYSKAVYPVMQKIIKLQSQYAGVNSISCAGHKEAIDNATNSIRTFLMNNINENIVDVLEGVRALLIDELETKQKKDITEIMKQIPAILQISADHGYFIATMQLPKPKVEV
jgi:uncharacterized protein YjiS (DUF1127 family)